jgi:hypothetical protein
LKKLVSRVGLSALAPKAATPPPVVLTPPVPNVTDTDKLFGDASTSEFMDVLNESAVNIDDSIGPFGDEIHVEEVADEEVDDDDADEEVDDDVTEIGQGVGITGTVLCHQFSPLINRLPRPVLGF